MAVSYRAHPIFVSMQPPEQTGERRELHTPRTHKDLFHFSLVHWPVFHACRAGRGDPVPGPVPVPVPAPVPVPVPVVTGGTVVPVASSARRSGASGVRWPRAANLLVRHRHRDGASATSAHLACNRRRSWLERRGISSQQGANARGGDAGDRWACAGGR